MSDIVGRRAETCWDPHTEELHSCPGRCVCYVNHYCNPGCVCTSCRDAHRRAPSEADRERHRRDGARNALKEPS